jgi:hypothetical protein
MQLCEGSEQELDDLLFVGGDGDLTTARTYRNLDIEAPLLA